jgi:bacteriocin biosynthesis cyclodehydratase domain-containing protein
MADVRRPRLALPFTVLASPGIVRLVAGEDFRYTLQADGLDRWLPGLLARLDGRRPLAEALAGVPEAEREAAAGIVDRLYGERVLVDGAPAEAHPGVAHRLVAEGLGPLLDGLASGPSTAPALSILCQDRLDYDEALRFNRARLDGGGPWMWASTGPMARGYVSPVFLPTSGPCLACLLRQFRRRSPAPELYDELEEQGRSGRPIEASTFPAEGSAILRNVILRKAAMLAEPGMPAAPYRLHVLEVATLEVSSHRVYRDPECGDCGGRRR